MSDVNGKNIAVSLTAAQVLSLAGAKVTQWYWSWFIVAAFGVHALTFKQAFALSICIGFELMGPHLKTVIAEYARPPKTNNELSWCQQSML